MHRATRAKVVFEVQATQQPARSCLHEQTVVSAMYRLSVSSEANLPSEASLLIFDPALQVPGLSVLSHIASLCVIKLPFFDLFLPGKGCLPRILSENLPTTISEISHLTLPRSNFPGRKLGYERTSL